MTRFRLAVALAILSATSVAAAQGAPPPSPQYVNVRLGAFSPKSDDLQRFNAGVAGEIAFGYRAAPNFAAELGIGYFRSVSDTATVYDPTYGNVSVDLELGVVPITGTAKFIVPLGQLEPYAAIGLGVYMATMKGTARASGVSDSLTNDSTSFGVHFGGGVLANVTDRVSLGLDVRYLIASGTFSDFLSSDLSYDGLQFGAVAAYRF